MKKSAKIFGLLLALVLIFSLGASSAFALVVVDVDTGTISAGSTYIPTAPAAPSKPSAPAPILPSSPGSVSCSHDWSTPNYYQDVNGNWIAERSCLKGCGAVQYSVGTVKENIIKKATCTEAGLRTFTAEFPDAWAGKREFHREEIPALGHSVDTNKFHWVGDEWFHYNVCDRCGERSNPQEHIWGEWQVIKNPTSQNAGKAIQYCTVCGCNRTCEIPKQTPKTGDNAMMGLWLGLGLVSMIGAVSIAAAKKKHN